MNEKKVGRPNEGLNVALHVMVTEDLNEVIKKEAAAAGKTVSQWVREACEAKAGGSPWKDLETRTKEDAIAIKEAMQRWHNRGDRS